MLFKSFSIFSSGGHFVQQSRTILAILVKGVLEEHFCEIILQSGPWPRRKSCLKILLFFFALDAILFSGMAPF